MCNNHKGHESGQKLPFSSCCRAVKVVFKKRLAQQQSFLSERSSVMAQTISEMAFFLDTDLTTLQLMGCQSHHSKHCRLCCTTAVCEDIWKKFALEEIVFPTPPVSPQLSPEPVSDSEEEMCYLDQMATLDEIAASLYEVFEEEEDDDDDVKYDKQQLEELETYHNLKSKLIQDCMWGSSSQSSTTSTYTPAPSPISFSDSELIYTESVDPSMVIPLVCRSTSNHIRHSCSSQDETDEEIDVVTVEKNKCPEKRMSHSAPETPVSSPLKKKQRLMSRVSSHSGSNRYRHLSSSYRQRRRISRIEVERRASHNVLERKRRNDLKSSFNTLREHVPDLESNEKAPKVMILQKAACYISEMKQLDAKLMEEKFEEQRKQELLLHKLHKLKEFYSCN